MLGGDRKTTLVSPNFGAPIGRRDPNTVMGHVGFFTVWKMGQAGMEKGACMVHVGAWPIQGIDDAVPLQTGARTHTHTHTHWHTHTHAHSEAKSAMMLTGSKQYLLPK